MSEIKTKLCKLKDILAGMEGILIAYSGGTDSSLLLRVAVEVLGENVVAATVRAPIFPTSGRAAAEDMVHQLGARHLFIEMGISDDRRFLSNPPDRCYICKRILFSKLKQIAREQGIAEVIEGSNHDDLSEYRPGLKALGELSIRSPLVEVGFTKAEIRSLSHEMGLPTWNKPSDSCLATRFPYGEYLTPEKLRRVEEAEDLLRSLIPGQLRVRDHGLLARIEVPKHEMSHLLLEMASEVVNKFKGAGYTYVTLDLEGYRTGSMDET